jgi:multiple sugar transport system permease protein
MRSSRSRRTTLVAYLFLTPAILGLVFITVLPLLGVVGISLTHWSGLVPPTYIGLDNYRDIFTVDPYFARSVVATLYFAVGAVIMGTLYAFFVALMLNQRIPGRGFFRSVFFLPYVVPSVGASVVWGWMYEANFGVFNYFLSLFGFDKVQWLGNDITATPSIIALTVWGLGNFIVIFLAGLQSVPTSYLEAVEIDGGRAWHKFRHVTLPLMSPIIFFNVLMSLVTNLQIFIPARTLTKGGPNNSTLYMVLLIFREGFERNNFGHAAAVSLIFFLFIGALTGLIFATSRKWLFFEGA